MTLKFFMKNLHMELNRVVSSDIIDFIETPENPLGLKSDKEMSRKWKEDYLLKTDDSIMTDLFYGQTKKTYKCVECGETTATFDPFSTISLDIPTENRI